MSQDTTAIPTDALVDMAIALAIESPSGENHVDDDIEWSLNDLDPVHVEYDEQLVVAGFCEGSFSRLVNRRTRHHPAEYESVDTRVAVTIEVTLDDGLPMASWTADVEGHSPGEPRHVPEYDPVEHKR